ncbi:MAG: aminoacyl--tRNA ligase-related protein, partial [Planctomycetota bacterium]
MLDPKWVRDHPDVVREAARKKRFDPALVDAYIEADRAWREILTRVEEQRGELKAASKALGKMSPEEREGALALQRAAKEAMKRDEAQESELRAEVQALAMRLPMPPADEVPEGKDDQDNVELEKVGEPPAFDFEPKSHDELGQALGIIDIPRGVKLAGTRNYLLLGDAARLERAVLQFALDHMLARGFEMVAVPTLVNRACMEGTGYFPGGEEQAYLAERDDLSLVGTAEVPLTSIHSGETLAADELPLRRVALSPCYRREAGTYGKDTRGLYRVHQFQKVEQVIVDVADKDRSLAHHQSIVQN